MLSECHTGVIRSHVFFFFFKGKGIYPAWVNSEGCTRIVGVMDTFSCIFVFAFCHSVILCLDYAACMMCIFFFYFISISLITTIALYAVFYRNIYNSVFSSVLLSQIKHFEHENRDQNKNKTLIF